MTLAQWLAAGLVAAGVVGGVLLVQAWWRHRNGPGGTNSTP